MTAVETHRTTNINWLRAAVMGANDGIVSTASIVVGVAAANATQHNVFVAGAAGLVAGAMSMAAGEYVSVSSQSDTENADLERERQELVADYDMERAELAAIYEARGVERALAVQVSDQLMAHDALGAHARDELGIIELQRANPLQAALASAAAFFVGGIVPVLLAVFTPVANIKRVVVVTSLVSLTLLGFVSARIGGASVVTGAVRVVFWGGLAMALTYGVGSMIGTPV